MYGRWSYENFKNKNIAEATNYLNKIEKLYNENPNILINPELFCEIYLKAGSYYYGERNYIKAEKMLKKGLEYNQEHNGLNKILRFVMEDKN